MGRVHRNMEKRGYKFLNHIAQGSTCDVWTAQSLLTDVVVAVKVIKKAPLFPELQAIVSKELQIHKKLDNPFIIRLYDYFEDDYGYYFVMELAEEGSFQSFLNMSGPVLEPTAKKFFVQLMCAIKYLHEDGKVMHRDIKCENCLLDRYGNLKLVDFGVSSEIGMTKCSCRTTICGSPGYMSPEIIKGLPYTEKCDIWSAGVLLYAMLCQYLPFTCDSIPKTHERVLFAEPQYPPYLSDEAVDLLSGMLKKDPHERLSLEDVIHHPWFDQALLEKYEALQKKNMKFKVSIVHKMIEMGIFDANLQEELDEDKWTQETSAYRILSRMESNNSLTPVCPRVRACHEQSLWVLPRLAVLDEEPAPKRLSTFTRATENVVAPKKKCFQLNVMAKGGQIRRTAFRLCMRK